MSTFSIALIVLTAVLGFASVGGIYITNVTVKPGGIPRWVMYLSLSTLLVGLGALLSIL